MMASLGMIKISDAWHITLNTWWYPVQTTFKLAKSDKVCKSKSILVNLNCTSKGTRLENKERKIWIDTRSSKSSFKKQKRQTRVSNLFLERILLQIKKKKKKTRELIFAKLHQTSCNIFAWRWLTMKVSINKFCELHTLIILQQNNKKGFYIGKVVIIINGKTTSSNHGRHANK